MALYSLTAALNAASFPMVSRYQPRSVIIPQYDGRLRDPTTSTTSNADNNPSNVPQMTYCENVLPTSDGVMSVGYTNVLADFVGAGVCFGDDVYVLRNGDTGHWYFCPAQGRNYVTNDLMTVPWASTNPLAGLPVVAGVSTADVDGVTYVCYANTAVLRWEGGAGFTDVSGLLLGGVVAPGIRAICGSGNYLILVYADNSVKWSSLTNPLDFTPSAATGAGSQIPLDIRGNPLYASQISGGFLVHCTENVVAAVYTQNVAQPWIFREVKNSGGLVNGFDNVSREASTGFIYQYSTYGMQQLNLRDAETIHPSVSDYIIQHVVEEFDTVTNLLSITSRGPLIYSKVAFLGGRYLCISLGPARYQYKTAVIFDVALKRWGKLKVDHSDIFARVEAGQDYALHVLKTTGAVDHVIIDGSAVADSGVLILGKYQLSRSAQLCSQELELEVLDASDDLDVFIATSYNGTTVGQILQMIEYASTDNYRKYQKQIEGENLTYIIKGSFMLATALLTVTKGARS